MKRRFQPTNRNHHRPVFIAGLSIGWLMVLALIISMQLPRFQEKFYLHYRNVSISFYDYSVLADRPSVQILIDGKPIHSADSHITNTLFIVNYTDIQLKEGQHVIQALLPDHSIERTDTVLIDDYSSDYHLVMSYSHSPSLNTFKRYLISHVVYRNDTAKFSLEKRQNWIRQASDSIDKVIENRLPNYAPHSRSIDLDFNKQPEVLIM